MAPRLMYLDLASPTEAQRRHSPAEKILHRENYSTTLPAHFHLFPRRFAQQPYCRAADFDQRPAIVAMLRKPFCLPSLPSPAPHSDTAKFNLVGMRFSECTVSALNMQYSTLGLALPVRLKLHRSWRASWRSPAFVVVRRSPVLSSG